MRRIGLLLLFIVGLGLAWLTIVSANSVIHGDGSIRQVPLWVNFAYLTIIMVICLHELFVELWYQITDSSAVQEKSILNKPWALASFWWVGFIIFPPMLVLSFFALVGTQDHYPEF